MYHDLNFQWPVSYPAHANNAAPSSKKKDKGKQPSSNNDQAGSSPAGGNKLALNERQNGQLLEAVQDAIELGYRTIAFNVNVPTRFTAAEHRPPFASGSAPFPELDPRSQSQPSSSRRSNVSSMRQLSRMTLVLNDESMGKHGHGITSNNQAALNEFDLLAAQPFNDASFSALCLSLTELKPISIDIIALDFASHARPPFFLRRSLVNAAIANGAVFEVRYSAALTSASGTTDDAGDRDLLKARRNIISATRDLLRVTNGRNVILSSGARDIMGIRGPLDVINLASIFGMNVTAAKDAISSTCHSLILRAETRKTFRGVVSDAKVVVQRASDPPNPTSSGDRKRKLDGAKEDESAGPVAGNGTDSANVNSNRATEKGHAHDSPDGRKKRKKNAK